MKNTLIFILIFVILAMGGGFIYQIKKIKKEMIDKEEQPKESETQPTKTEPGALIKPAEQETETETKEPLIKLQEDLKGARMLA